MAICSLEVTQIRFLGKVPYRSQQEIPSTKVPKQFLGTYTNLSTTKTDFSPHRTPEFFNHKHIARAFGRDLAKLCKESANNIYIYIYAGKYTPEHERLEPKNEGLEVLGR